MFWATWKASARKRNDAAPCGAPRNHNDIPWKPLVKQCFLHVRADGTWCIQLSPFARQGESYGYSKAFENHWENMVPWCDSKMKTTLRSFEHLWKTLEKHGYVERLPNKKTTIGSLLQAIRADLQACYMWPTGCLQVANLLPICDKQQVAYRLQ